MNRRELLRRLAEHYPLIVRTEYHVQIETAGGMHNIWLAKSGLKFKAAGDRHVQQLSAERLLKLLAGYSYAKTDLAYMHRLGAFLNRIKGKQGIYVDAGWKEGRAKIAVVRLYGENMDVAVRSIETATNIAAEAHAIDLACRLYPGDEPIFSDCQPACEGYHRARWIPRESNKEADRMSNLRTNG